MASSSVSLDPSTARSCLVSNIQQHFGLTSAAGLSGAAAIPISKAIVPPYRLIGTPTTNVLSLLGQYVEINVPRVIIAGRASTNLFRIAGRANPYLSVALTAADVTAIGIGTYSCYRAGTASNGDGFGGAGASGDW